MPLVACESAGLQGCAASESTFVFNVVVNGCGRCPVPVPAAAAALATAVNFIAEGDAKVGIHHCHKKELIARTSPCLGIHMIVVSISAAVPFPDLVCHVRL